MHTKEHTGMCDQEVRTRSVYGFDFLCALKTLNIPLRTAKSRSQTLVEFPANLHHPSDHAQTKMDADFFRDLFCG